MAPLGVRPPADVARALLPPPPPPVEVVAPASWVAHARMMVRLALSWCLKVASSRWTPSAAVWACGLNRPLTVASPSLSDASIAATAARASTRGSCASVAVPVGSASSRRSDKATSDGTIRSHPMVVQATTSRSGCCPACPPPAAVPCCTARLASQGLGLCPLPPSVRRPPPPWEKDLSTASCSAASAASSSACVARAKARSTAHRKGPGMVL